VITSPAANETPRVITDFFVFLEIAFAKGERITNPESQNIGIDTRKPVIARAISSLPLPSFLINVCAILSAAPDASNISPIITPKPIMIPMLPRVFPNPLEIDDNTSFEGIPPTKPVTAAAIIKAKNA